MKKQKPQVKKIRTEKDIDNLRRKDLVNVRDKGVMIYKGIHNNVHKFLGRLPFGEIVELNVMKYALFPTIFRLSYFPSEYGSLDYSFFEEHILDRTTRKKYNSRNKQLLEVGL